jgi:DNA ligase-1
MTLKTMLSCNTIPNIDTEVPYPCLVSAKLDGIRGMILDGRLVSRTHKMIPNNHVQRILANPLFEGLDGELTLRDDPHNFNANQSAFMSRDGRPDFVFNVFDDRSQWPVDAKTRKERTKERVVLLITAGHTTLAFCSQHVMPSAQHVRVAYEKAREAGYEGLIIMHPDKPYKSGRSTLKQQISLKLKPCDDAEAVIIGMDELMHNLDAGNSNKKENMVPGGMMGALIGRMPCGTIMKCGTGFTHAQRQDFWDRKADYYDVKFTYKFMEVFPDTGAPRSAVFKGLRYE